jgi:hypothetical protein
MTTVSLMYRIVKLHVHKGEEQDGGDVHEVEESPHSH